MRKLVKLAARRLGYEVTRVRTNIPEPASETDPFLQMRTLVTAPNPMVFDVGANVGQTAQVVRSMFPNAAIHCFEPFPASFQKLAASLDGDPLSTCHELALSSAIGTAELTENKSSATNSLLASDDRASQYWGESLLETVRTVSVKTTTIDAFCADRGIGHVDILKLDVQGAEYDVLLGSREMMARQAIDLVYMEMIVAPTYVGQRRLHQYLELFDSHGYEMFGVYNSIHRRGRLIQTDNIMVSSRLLALYEEGRGYETGEAGTRAK